MPDYLTDVELAEIQNVYSSIRMRIQYYKTNYPYATNEIREMEIALDVLDNLIMDID